MATPKQVFIKSQLVFRVEVSLRLMLPEIVSEAIALSITLGLPVQFYFNETLIEVNRDSSELEIVDKYIMDRRIYRAGKKVVTKETGDAPST